MSMSMNERQEAALQRLVEKGELSAAQADAVRREFAVEPERTRGWLVEVAGYLGGGLTIAGAALLLSNTWEEMGRALRAGVLGATAVLFVVAALVIANGPEGIRRVQGARRRAAGVLLSLAAIPAGWAVGVAVNSSDDEVWGFLAGLVVSLLCLALMTNTLGLLVAGVMTMGSVITLMNNLFDASWLATGIVLIIVGALWTFIARRAKRTFGMVIGFVLAFTGAQLPLDGTAVWAYILTLAVAAACLLLYRMDREMVMLAGGVIAVTVAVPEAIYDITNGALGAAAIVLIAGVVLIAASAVGMRLHRGDKASGDEAKASEAKPVEG